MKRALIICLLALIIGPSSYGQLISPGELIGGHAPWDRIDRCTSCHDLGSKGISDEKCLSCHAPLQSRIDEGLGLHATYDEPTCASCHKDHFGREFDAVRFDTLAFDHVDAGYDLVKSHADVTCSNCHKPSLIVDQELISWRAENGADKHTYLGLVEACLSCHETDSPHEEQFVDVACSTCHDEADWEQAVLFDHATANFPLDGAHLDVECEDCHSSRPDGVVNYVPVAFGSCLDCHDDPHAGAMAGTCTACHSTEAWASIPSDFEDTFDHTTTGFTLLGAHVTASCESCHTPSDNRSEFTIRFEVRSGRYPAPIATECDDCHSDAHDGSVGQLKAATCESCHTESAWKPSRFGVERHNNETEFMLVGAHIAVVCESCHTGTSRMGHMTFDVQGTACIDCHEPDDPHNGQFQGTTCQDCHDVGAWSDAADNFDHSTTEFDLLGVHAVTPCVSCHIDDDRGVRQYTELSALCMDCHADEDPHAGQFANRSCADCHDETSFLVEAFDHSTTRFPLDGVHAEVSCTSCHTSADESDVIQFTGLGIACEDCHDQ